MSARILVPGDRVTYQAGRRRMRAVVADQLVFTPQCEVLILKRNLVCWVPRKALRKLPNKEFSGEVRCNGGSAS